MVFTDVIFPVCISYGSEFRPTYETLKTEVLSGAEQRMTRQENVKMLYKINVQNMPAEELREIINIFHVVSGDLYGFLFVDPTDHTSANTERSISDSLITGIDQYQGAATGEPMMLFKNYIYASRVKRRRIRYPKLDTLMIYANGAPVDFAWDEATQTFTTSGSGTISAGYEYYVPVRFDVGEMGIEPTHGMDEALVANLNDIKLLELFE